MKRLLHKLSTFAVGILLTLAGCATPLPMKFVDAHPDPTDELANIFLIRDASPFGNKVWPAMLLNGKRVAPLPDGTYTLVRVKPGNYSVTMEKEQVWSGSWSGDVTVDVKPGKNHYIQLTLLYRYTSGFLMAGPTPIFTREAVSMGQRLTLLDEGAGRALVTSLPYVEPYLQVLR